jgi:hypothetical protein
VPLDLSNVVAIAVGPVSYHSLALKSDGTVVGWGNNDYGQITIPPGLSGVVGIAAGLGHNLAIKAGGTVVTWGRNGDGESAVPAGLNNVFAVAAGLGNSLALKSDGTVVAWGSVNGLNIVPAGLRDVTAVSAGNGYNLALKRDGTVVGWGYGTPNEQATAPAGLSNVIAIAAGTYYSAALVSVPAPTSGCVLDCPTNMVVCADPEGCGAMVRFAPAAAGCDGLTIVSTPPPGSFFPLGTTTVLCAAVDAFGQVSNLCSFHITVRDCQAPAIHSITAAPANLWPPNNKMRPVTLTVSATDNCHIARTKITSVSSSEAGSADWEITGDLTLNLRAQRLGTGTGRVYTVVIECTDDSGNASTSAVHITVPH